MSSAFSPAGSAAALFSAARRAPLQDPPRRFDPFRPGTALLRRLPPNLAHRAALLALRYRLVPGDRKPDDPVLAMRLWGLEFANPLGMSAGFDKDAEALDGLAGLGFGFVEAGTVTPRPQPGNPQPNLFRLREDRGLINRLGFPSRGLDVFAGNFASRAGSHTIAGANIGMNTGSQDPLADIAAGIRRLAGLASYLVINVSCPNTPGLCVWQEPDHLKRMLDRAVAERDATGAATPLLVKVSPDLDEDGLAAVADTVLAAGIDGLIAANTTTVRPQTLRSPEAGEQGGLSGPPLFDRATAVLAALYRLTGGTLPIIGCGGVSDADDAYAKIRAGASLVQLYTALVYSGPALVREIKDGLAVRLKADGYGAIADAVGADHR